MNNARIFLAGLLYAQLLLMACNQKPRYKDGFYNGAKVGELKRLPLIKPYELVKDDVGWQLGFVYSGKFGGRIDHLFIKKNDFIIGYGHDGELHGDNDTIPFMTYILIDLKNKYEHVYYKAEKFDSVMNSVSVANKDFYSEKDLKVIYANYSKTGKLPWYKE